MAGTGSRGGVGPRGDIAVCRHTGDADILPRLMPSAETLEKSHIADLHALAADAGIKGYRLLPRAELVAAILEANPDASVPEKAQADSDDRPKADSSGGESRSRGRRRRGRRGSGRREEQSKTGADQEEDGKEPVADEADEADEKGSPVEGVLDITPRGHGFIRLNGLESTEGDVYVSPSQIRRCDARRGDTIGGPAREARRGERYPALIHVDTVNGREPDADRPSLADATPVHPSRRIELEPASGTGPEESLLLRTLNRFNPLARGQRVLIKAAPGAGRTTLLRTIAASLESVEDIESVVLLVDERPEEVAAWRTAAPSAQFAIATSEMRSGEQLRLVELAVGRASRRAEAGADVVLLIDSISRIAIAADDPGRVKPIFGAGRETNDESVGSLTIIATTLGDEGEDEGGVERVLATTETSRIVLDPSLAAAGIYPAIDVGAGQVVGEEHLRDADELAAVRAERLELGKLAPEEAAAEIRKRLG